MLTLTLQSHSHWHSHKRQFSSALQILFLNMHLSLNGVWGQLHSDAMISVSVAALVVYVGSLTHFKMIMNTINSWFANFFLMFNDCNEILWPHLILWETKNNKNKLITHKYLLYYDFYWLEAVALVILTTIHMNACLSKSVSFAYLFMKLLSHY